MQGTSYVKYAVNDLNQDGLWELVVLRADEEGNGIADYYCWQEEEFQLRTSARITSTMAELSRGSIVAGRLSDGTPAVFATGVNSQGMAMTDVLIWQENGGGQGTGKMDFLRQRRRQREPDRNVSRSGRRVVFPPAGRMGRRDHLHHRRQRRV